MASQNMNRTVASKQKRHSIKNYVFLMGRFLLFYLLFWAVFIVFVVSVAYVSLYFDLQALDHSFEVLQVDSTVQENELQPVPILDEEPFYLSGRYYESMWCYGHYIVMALAMVAVFWRKSWGDAKDMVFVSVILVGIGVVLGVAVLSGRFCSGVP